MTEAIDVVRAAFAALERGDTATAFGAFASTLTYRLHGAHPLAGTFDDKEDALRALAALSRAGGPGSTLSLADAWAAGRSSSSPTSCAGQMPGAVRSRPMSRRSFASKTARSPRSSA